MIPTMSLVIRMLRQSLYSKEISMTKLTKETWFRTLPEDLRMSLWLLWRAVLAFLTFEFGAMHLCLLMAWIHIRYEHEIFEVEEE